MHVTHSHSRWPLQSSVSCNNQSLFLTVVMFAVYVSDVALLCFSAFITGSRLKEQLDSGTYYTDDEGKREWLTHFMAHKFPLRYGVDISAFITLAKLNHMAMPHISGSQK